MNIINKLERLGACKSAILWLESLPDQSPEYVWANCPDGSWMLWAHARAGTRFVTMAPVVYAAANRAVREYAPAALRAAGLDDVADTLLRNAPVITDAATARDAADAADAAASGMADAAREARHMVYEAADVAREAADAAFVAARMAAYVARETARETADDCRRYLSVPVI